MIDNIKYQNHIDKLSDENQLRYLRELSSKRNVEVDFQNKRYINFSSNDYLGLAFDEELHKEFYKKINSENILESYGLGSSSSRLLTGNNTSYIDKAALYPSRTLVAMKVKVYFRIIFYQLWNCRGIENRVLC